MNIFSLLIVIFFVACTNNTDTTTSSKDQTATRPLVTAEELEKLEKHDHDTTPVELYSNARFKEVKVEKLGNNTFRITGKAQIFEASFNWVIEENFIEVKQGHAMTDAGAPEWGNFNFTVVAKKKSPNSLLDIILFESSAKDGSRQHELPVPLK